jgi:hypothetical protein
MTMMNNRDVIETLKPLVGQRPWRVRLGWGSFVTFDFGAKIQKDKHWYGTWHLWIYQSEWELLAGDQVLAHSESKRQVMDLAVQRLEHHAFQGAHVSKDLSETTFAFGTQFRFVCRRYKDFRPGDDDGEYWLCFLPGNQVISVGPDGAKQEAQQEHRVRV